MFINSEVYNHECPPSDWTLAQCTTEQRQNCHRHNHEEGWLTEREGIVA